MNIERKIEDCDIFLNQIRQYDPDPYYVNYFLEQFIKTINQIFEGIFEEANKGFGLYINEENSERKFNEIAIIKNDKKAIEFSKWFETKNQKEHENTFPNFIREICKLKKQNMPKLKIMLRPKERYIDDIFQEINPRLINGKLSSKDELEIEISRQLPIFLEIINHKRKEKNEPKVKKEQIISSAFLRMNEKQDIEVSYTVEIYIPVIKRIIVESREKIQELTTWS